MKKIIGGVLLFICLSQPALYDYLSRSYFELLHIHPFYVQVVDDELKKKDTAKIENKDQQVQSLIEQLHNNTRRLTELLESKNNVITMVKSKMNEKARTRQRMTEDQIQVFNEFIQMVETETPKIQTALAQINGAKDMKEVQQEIMKEEMNYDKSIEELNEIIEYQSAAIASLDQVLQLGDHTVTLLA